MSRKRNIRLKAEQAYKLGLNITKSGQYRITQEQYDAVKGNKFEDYCIEQGIDKSEVSAYWDKSDSYSILVRPNPTKSELTPEYIREVIGEIPTTTKLQPKANSDEILRVIITDVHIGMETDAQGYGMFSEVWNTNVANDRLDILLSEVSRLNKKYKEVHVICLGDYLDSWNGQTTRGGHHLPSNLDNRGAFKSGVSFKTRLYTSLQELTKTRIKAFNVCNDNHSSDFGYIVNETVKYICEAQNENIKVNNLQRFMSHYTVGKHTFILCHGKDERHMRFGLKPKLDAVIKDKIMQYIKHYGIDSEYITFEKGDSHVQLLDSTSSNEFEYNNYRAFSPASSWVNHNFGKSTSGFTLMTIRENEKSKNIFAYEF